MPKKTLTALLPVTLPTELSAVLSCMAATLLAKVSVQKNKLFIHLSKPKSEKKCRYFCSSIKLSYQWKLLRDNGMNIGQMSGFYFLCD